MRRGTKQRFASEADLVAAACDAIERVNHVYRDKPGHHMRWTIYRETAGFDLLLVQDSTGVQVGVEAKLVLNLKVLDQALPRRYDAGWHRPAQGPDYRAVLVPQGGTQRDLGRIAECLGLTVLNVYNQRHDPSDDADFEPWPGWVKPVPEWSLTPSLPDETEAGMGLYGDHWHPWCPEERCALPDYVPDVAAGVASPIILSAWKVKAIKLLIVLERRGWVTRADMRFLQISPTIWTGFRGFLAPDDQRGRYVSCSRTPDYRKQHPRVWEEIAADIEIWGEGLELD